MRLAFVCSGRPDNLKYLKNNRNMVAKLLNKYGWEIINTPLDNIANLNKRLKEYEQNSVDEFIFFYTGHGAISPLQQVFQLEVDNAEITISQVLESIFKYINPKKQAIIIDACYSGTLTGLDKVLKKNTEFLFSSQAMELSYEDDKLKASVFSYYFCEAIEKIGGHIALRGISEYISWKVKKQKTELINISNNPIILANKLLKNDNNIKEKKNVIFFFKKYGYILIMPFIVLLLVFLFKNEDKKKKTVFEYNMTTVKKNNHNEILYAKITKLLNKSKELAHGYISEYPTKEDLNKEIKIKEVYLKQKVLKYNNIRSEYIKIREEYDNFLKKENNSTSIMKIDLALNELYVLLESLDDTINTDRLIIDILKKRKNSIQNILKVQKNIINFDLSLDNFKKEMIGEDE